jgi:hypothetical protein
MKSRKKKTNKELEKGITWCMTEIYAMKLALQAIHKQVKDLGDTHKD